MKITLIQIGKTVDKHIIGLNDEYIKRIKRYIAFEVVTLPDLKQSKSLTKELIKSSEGQLILQNFQKGDYIILLDEKGKEYTSIAFSTFLQKKMNMGVKRLVFVIGGAYGFSDDVYKVKNDMISLSKMTFNHQMVRLFFLEQIYRGFTILNNEPYHHE